MMKWNGMFSRWRAFPKQQRTYQMNKVPQKKAFGTVSIGWFLAIFIQVLSGCASNIPEKNLTGAETYKQTMDLRVNGFRRSYLVHLPAGYQPDKPYPLVVIIHGAFDTAEGMEKFSGFSALADRKGFVALYPNGVGIMGYLQHWNAGHCCGKAAKDNWDDVGFLADTIADVSARLNIDRDRVYMVGFSNGGMLVYRFAAEKGHLLAAAAPMAASIGGKPSPDEPEWRIPEPGQPLSLIIFHGLADDDIPFEGGVSRYRKSARTYWPVSRSVDFWTSQNQCRTRLPDRSLNDGSVRVAAWVDCARDTEVRLVLIENWGHIWPGKFFTAKLAPEDPLKNFDASEMIWDFFKTRRRKR
jgi:polyhydroxybutyrate depolymerase